MKRGGGRAVRVRANGDLVEERTKICKEIHGKRVKAENGDVV